MKIPILLNHDSTKMIGTCIDGVVTIVDEFKITQYQMFNMIGDAGVKVLEDEWIDNIRYIKKFKILEFSLEL